MAKFGLNAAKGRNITLAGAIVLSLALAGVATLAVAGIADAVFFSPLAAVQAPDSLVMPHARWPAGLFNAFSYRQFQTLGTSAEIESAAAFAHRRVSVRAEHGVASVDAALVSSGYFSTLGIPMRAGRPPSGSGAAVDTHVVVLGRRMAFSLLGNQASWIGAEVSVNGVPFRVSGVVADNFSGIDLSRPCDVFLPIEAATIAFRSISSPASSVGFLPDLPWLSVVARIRPGSGVTRLAARVSGTLGDSHPVVLLPFRDSTMPLDERARVAKFVSLLAVLLALSWLTVFGSLNAFFLTWCAGDARSSAIKVALGATRTAIIGPFVAWGVALGVVGGLLAVGIGYRLVPLLFAHWLPGQLPRGVMGAAMTWRVAGLVVGATTCAAGIAAAVASWTTSAQPATQALRATGRDSLPVRSRQRLVTVQVLLAVASLSLTSSLAWHVRRELSRDFGFTKSPVMLASLDLESLGHAGDRALEFWHRFVERVSQRPGVRSATVTTGYFGRAGGSLRSVFLEGHERRCSAFVNYVGPAYFTTLGIPVLRGRDCDVADSADRPHVAVVNERLARSLWPDRDPLGLAFSLGPEARELRVVGIVANTLQSDVTNVSDAGLYLPFRQYPERGAQEKTLAIRTDLPRGRAFAVMVDALASVEPAAALNDVGTLVGAVEATLAPQRVAAQLFGAVALLAGVLVLAAVYGVVASAVVRKARDVGIRSALGQTPWSLAGWIVTSSLSRQLCTGLIGGLVLAAVLSRSLASRLHGFGQLEWLPALGAAAAVALVCAVGAVVPAYRSARTEPAASLRDE